MPTTILDVARQAGVSIATASRILAGIGPARPETRDRVLTAALNLNYRPSGVARSLQRRTTETLGLIVTDIENPFFPELVRAIEDAARDEGYAILLCNAEDDADREASYLALLVERRVDGLIIAASSLGTHHAAWLASPPLPVVLVNTSTPDIHLPAIRSDNRAGTRAAAHHLLARGHRRFGYLMPPPRNVDAPDRLAGLEDALREAGLGPGSIALAYGLPLAGGGSAAMNEIFESHPLTTAVLAYNDLMAIGAMHAIRQRGLKVPDDLSIIGFDDVAVAAYLDPPLTTLRQSKAAMGRWAVQQLMLQFRGRAHERFDLATKAGSRTRGGVPNAADVLVPATAVIPVHLEVRGSTAPASHD